MGHGSSHECLPFDNACPGLGYVQVTARQLRAQGFTVNLSNLGLPTAVIGHDFEALGQQYGRTIAGNFIDQELPFVPGSTTLVTIFAGGNEVNTITTALGAGEGASDQAGYIDAQVRAFGTDFSTLMGGIAGKAATRVIVLNVPNLAGLPYLTGASLPQRQAAQRASVGMTTSVINRLASPNVSVVDLMCDSRSYLPSNYSADGFHPNDAGYAFIAEEVVRAALGAASAPQAGCPAMSLVPAP
jgi:lysophospholipase L1-like esterase